ncbi:MAG TPA: hypothetical protein DCP63_06090 [Bacteroidetes bacterium]|nr:hypothetical protein [Bacteroidota bacterium]
MLQRLKDWLALTAAEQKVLLFLATAFVIGVGIRLYQETVPSPQEFDYRTADSTFKALSSKLDDHPDGHGRQDTARLVNLNTASKEQLIKLPGIGETTAERIILYREDVGKFEAPEDLKKIKGISKKKYDQLKSLITVQ